MSGHDKGWRRFENAIGVGGFTALVTGLAATTSQADIEAMHRPTYREFAQVLIDIGPTWLLLAGGWLTAALVLFEFRPRGTPKGAGSEPTNHPNGMFRNN